ncbi:MAG: NAD-dependent deacylase [Candidatus Poseidoniaceae archaeon]|nr:NAD-dependent deacylase [Candidatus Poseidoniaceae archaeon]
MLKKGMKVAVLTGAGISAESGIRTFRAEDGLWEEHRLEDVATPQAWNANPEMVWRFYQARRRQLLEVEVNPAHDALAELEEGFGEDFTLITQNVDDLHERAGSKRFIQMHGELRKLRCEECGHVCEAMEPEQLKDDYVPCSNCSNQRLRPHIVWFDEEPFGRWNCEAAVHDCDVFIVVGTSGHVYPANNLLPIARHTGSYCIGVNLDPPLNVDFFHEFHQGKAGELLPGLVKEWLES